MGREGGREKVAVAVAKVAAKVAVANRSRVYRVYNTHEFTIHTMEIIPASPPQCRTHPRCQPATPATSTTPSLRRLVCDVRIMFATTSFANPQTLDPEPLTLGDESRQPWKKPLRRPQPNPEAGLPQTADD
jgi:hypothetical protein